VLLFQVSRSDSNCKKAKSECEYYKAECKRAERYRIINEIGDFLDKGPGSEYFDHNERIERRKLCNEGKQICAAKNSKCKDAKPICFLREL
jgi:hypothetical protein